MSLWSSLNDLKGQVVGKVSETVSTIAQEFKDGADELGYNRQVLSMGKKEDNVQYYEDSSSSYNAPNSSVTALKAKLAAEKSRSQQQHQQIYSRYGEGRNEDHLFHGQQRYSMSGDGFRKRGGQDHYSDANLTTLNIYEETSQVQSSEGGTYERFRYNEGTSILEPGSVSTSSPSSSHKQHSSIPTSVVPNENSTLQQQFQKAKTELIRLSQDHQEEMSAMEQEHQQALHRIQVQFSASKQDNQKLKQEVVDLKRKKEAIESMAADLEQRLVQQSQNNSEVEQLQSKLLQEKKQHEDARLQLQQLQQSQSISSPEDDQNSSQIVMMEEEYERTMRSLSELKFKLAEYESRGVEAENLLIKEQNKNREAEEKLTSLQNYVDQLKNELDETNDALTSRDAVWKTQLESQRSEQNSSSEKIHQLSLQLQQISAERDQYLQQLEIDKADQLTQDQELTSLLKQVKEKDIKLLECERKVESLASECAELKVELLKASSVAQENQHKQQHELQNIQDQLEDLREQYEQVVSDWQVAMDEKDSQEIHFSKQLSTQQSELAKLQQNLEDTDKELNSVMLENVQLQEKISVLNNSLLEQDSLTTQSNVNQEQQQQQQEKIQILEGELQQLRSEVIQANDEKDKIKQQLTKLKNQLIQRQEVEEEASNWRTEQEVKQAVDSVSQDFQKQIQELQNQLQELQLQLSQRTSDQQQSDEEIHNLKSTLAARSTELQNLQAALGELSYESEAAGKLRHELFTIQSRCRTLEAQVTQLNAQHQESQSKLLEATKISENATKVQQQYQQQISQLSKECQHLRRALEESSKRMHALNSNQGAMVDRRIVAKLLTTFFEKKSKSGEIMELMAKMLDFDQEQRRRVGLDRGGGLLGSLFGSAGGVQRTQSDSFADQWADFLLEQATKEADKNSSKNQKSEIGQQSQQITQEKSYSEMVAAELHRSQQQAQQFKLNEGSLQQN